MYYFERFLTLYILQIVDPKTGEEKEVVILVDDGIRPSTYLLYFF
jgi:hypothetical protein